MILSCGQDHDPAEIAAAAKQLAKRPIGRPPGPRCHACGLVPSRCRCGAKIVKEEPCSQS